MERFVSRDIMYKKGNRLICRVLYDALTLEEKDKWVACVPDYDLLDRKLKEQIRNSQLTGGVLSIPFTGFEPD